MKGNKDTVKAIAALAAAASLWFTMFSPWTAPHVNFWLMMSCSALSLTALTALFRPEVFRKAKPHGPDILYGILIGAVLWGVFWAGDKISSMIFNFARPQVDMIYGIKEGTPAWMLSALLLVLIGPAEEIFWRGYIQEELSRRWNRNTAFAITLAVYTLVHVPSLNFMLVMAAFTAGLLWGLLYRLFPERLPALIISHALWDAAVFVWFPI